MGKEMTIQATVAPTPNPYPMLPWWEEWTGLSVLWQQSGQPHNALSVFPACSLPAQPLESQATNLCWCVTAGLPSALTVKGESPGRLAEKRPPKEVIRKHRLKKPTPTTKILQKRYQRMIIGAQQMEKSGKSKTPNLSFYRSSGNSKYSFWGNCLQDHTRKSQVLLHFKYELKCALTLERRSCVDSWKHF